MWFSDKSCGWIRCRSIAWSPRVLSVFARPGGSIERGWNDLFGFGRDRGAYLAVEPGRNGMAARISRRRRMTAPFRGEPRVIGQSNGDLYVWSDMTENQICNQKQWGTQTPAQLSFDGKWTWLGMTDVAPSPHCLRKSGMIQFESISRVQFWWNSLMKKESHQLNLKLNRWLCGRRDGLLGTQSFPPFGFAVVVYTLTEDYLLR